MITGNSKTFLSKISEILQTGNLSAKNEDGFDLSQK